MQHTGNTQTQCKTYNFAFCNCQYKRVHNTLFIWFQGIVDIKLMFLSSSFLLKSCSKVISAHTHTYMHVLNDVHACLHSEVGY